MNNSILLLRGLTREQRHWGNFPQLLQESLPHFTIYTQDIAGSGNRYKETSHLSINAIVNDLRHQFFNHSLPLTIIGHSMGGMIAMQWAQSYPQEVSHCICINTSNGYLSKFYQRLNWKKLPHLAKVLVSSGIKKQRLIYQITSNNALNNKVIEDWAYFQKTAPISFTNQIRQLIASAQFSLAIKPMVSTLFIASKQDQLVNYITSLQLAHFWQKPLKIHSTAGHDLPLDDPQWTIKHINHFIQG